MRHLAERFKGSCWFKAIRNRCRGRSGKGTRLLKAMDYNTSGKKPLMVKGGGLTLTTYL